MKTYVIVFGCFQPYPTYKKSEQQLNTIKLT